MKRTKHKILSVFLSFCMIISCMVGMSVTVSAAEYTTESAFNGAAEENPTLKLTDDVSDLTITRADGTVDLNGKTVTNLYLQNNVAGKTVTVKNGTVSNKIDGKSGWDDDYKGSVILENLTVTGTNVWADGHTIIIKSGTYDTIQNSTNLSGTSPKSTVTIEGGKFTTLNLGTKGETYSIKAGFFKSAPPASYLASGSTCSSSRNAEGYYEVTADYKLYINDTHVTSANTSGDGWSYNASTNTLTLSNYTFDGVGAAPPTDSTVIFYEPVSGTPLNIVLEGTNTIKQGKKSSNVSWGIYSRSDFTIGGTGTLDISTKDGAVRGTAIYSEQNLTIKDTCTVNATSGTVTGSQQGYGIGGGAGKTLTIGANAKVTLTGPKGGTEMSVINAAPGTGWTDTAGTAGATSIAASTSGQNLITYKKVQFPAADLEISSVEEWNAFVAKVNGGDTFAGKTVKLTADLEGVTEKIAIDKQFLGTFDGQGHIMIVNFQYPTSVRGAALFPYFNTNNASITVKNLTLGGVISGGQHTAGIIGEVKAYINTTINIENVNVVAFMTQSSTHLGGFIGHAGNRSTIKIKNCHFLGDISMSSGKATAIGGIVGWRENTTTTNISDASFGGTITNGATNFNPWIINFQNENDSYFTAGGTFKTNTSPSGDATTNCRPTAGACSTIEHEVESEFTYDGEAHGIEITVTAPASGAIITYGTEEGKYLSLKSPTVTNIGETKTVYYQIAYPNYTTVRGKAELSVIERHEHDGIRFSAWTSTNSLPTAAGSYYLENDVTISSTWTVPSGTTNLCLNGHGIKMTGSGSVIQVNSGITFNLYDCDTTTTHKYSIASPTSNGAGLAVVDDTNGTKTFTGGYITGGRAKDGGGVSVAANGQFTMNGGTIIGNQGTNECGGVQIAKGATMTMNGGAVIGNYAKSGGAGINARGILKMTGGTVAYNLAYNGGCGGGIRTHAPGGTTSYAEISGGSIINNYAASRGGGIGEGKVVLSGAPEIRDNCSGAGADNIYVLVSGTYFVYINGELTNTTPIGVKLPKGTGVFTTGTTTYNDASKFTSDNTAYTVAKNEQGQLILMLPVTITFDTDGGSAVAAITQGYGTKVTAPADPTKTGYTFAGWDKEIPATMPDKNVTITAKWKINTHTVTYKVNGAVYGDVDTVAYGTALTARTAPTKTGYTFGGWSEVPATMPDNDVVITGTFVVNTYKVTLNANEGTLPSDAVTEYTYGKGASLPTELTKEGYNFAGWYDNSALTGTAVNNIGTEETGDKVFYAAWDPINVTIFFDTNGGTSIEPITQQYGTVLTAPSAPTRTGYTFDGWDKTIPATVPSKNITVTAQWTVNSYTISFDTLEGTKISDITGNYGSAVKAPADPTRTGYTFSGWDKEMPAEMPAEDLVLTAVWTANNYTLTFDVQGGTAVEPITQAYGTAITVPDAPTKTGFTFAGWDKEIPGTVPAQDMTFTAKWQINSHTLTYRVDGAVYGDVETVDYGTALDLRDEPAKTGHTFSGWSEIPPAMPDEDVVITGTFTVNTYNVTLNANGGTLPAGAVTEYTYGKGASLPTELTKEGNKFAGWYDNSALTGTAVNNIGSEETGDKEFYAKWDPVNVTIFFDTNGGTTIEPITKLSGSALTAPAEPTKTGYTFDGWDKTIPTTMPAENVTVKAQWKIKQYTITFDTDGGSAIASIKQDYGTAVTAPADPTKTGYTFSGWDKAIPATMPAEDMAVKAKWTINQYTITFDTDGGSTIAPIKQNYGTAVTAPADPTKTGYTFSDWDKTIPAAMPAENVTITAKWTVNKYTITFDTDGGSAIAAITQDYGTAVTAPADPTKTGYTFDGWDKAIPTTMPAENTTIKAKWSTNGYKITLNTNDGTVNAGNVTSYTYGKGAALPTDVTKTGYAFGGWFEKADFSGSAVNNISETDTGDKTFYAKWNVNEYTIFFETDGGTTIDAVTAAFGKAITKPADPTKTGYIFAGWDKEIPATMPAENITVKAVWNVRTPVYAPTGAVTPSTTPSTTPAATSPITETPVTDEPEEVTLPSGTFEDITDEEKNAGDAAISSTDGELADAILDNSDRSALAQGENVQVFLEVEETEPTPEEAALIEEAISAAGKELVIAKYLDLNLFKKVGNNPAVQIHETNGLIEVSIDLPEGLENTDPTVERSYYIARIHDGKAEIIPATYDPETGKLSFFTDKFSVYAILFEDRAIADSDVEGDVTPVEKPVEDAGKGDDVNPHTESPLFGLAVLAMSASAAVAAFTAKKRKNK